MDDKERKKLLKPIKITAYIEPQIEEGRYATTRLHVSSEGGTFSWPVEIGRYLDDNGEVDWTRTLNYFSACRQYVLKHIADTVAHALEQLAAESRAHNLSESELEAQFASSVDLRQWEEDNIAQIKRQDERANELRKAGIPHDEMVEILHREAMESTALQREWFQSRVIDFATQSKNRLSGHWPYYLDSKKKWRTHDRNFEYFPSRYFRYRTLWNNAREFQKQLPKSLKPEEAKERVIEQYKELKSAKDLVDCLFERQRGSPKWSPSELAIVLAARHSGYWEAKMGQVRWLYEVLKAHPKYAEAQTEYGSDVEK